MIRALSNLLNRFALSRLLLPLGILLTTALGAVLRFVNLANPKTLVFDETYYVKDALTLGLTGSEKKWPDDANLDFEAGIVDGFLAENSYVVHPPVGKWVIYLGMQLFGAEDSFGWRFSVALLGTLAIPLIILTARLLFRSNKIAVLAGLMLAIEGHAVVMSRTAILDGILTFFVMLGFLFFVLDHQSWRRKLSLGTSFAFRPWLALSALTLGLAAGTKWSGLYFLALFGLFSFAADLMMRDRIGRNPYLALPQALVNALTMFLVSAASYVAGWTGWIVNGGWGRDAKGTWWESLIAYHQNALAFHTGLSTEHPYQSGAWEWLLSLRPTAFYFEKNEECWFPEGCSTAITAIPNPIIWLGGVLAMVWVLCRFLRLGDLTAGLIGTGFLAAWLPWTFFADRTTFQFYAVVLSPFLILALSYAVQRYLRRGFQLDRFPERVRAVATLILVALFLAAYFASIWMGLEVPHLIWQIQMWFPFWI